MQSWQAKMAPTWTACMCSWRSAPSWNCFRQRRQLGTFLGRGGRPLLQGFIFLGLGNTWPDGLWLVGRLRRRPTCVCSLCQRRVNLQSILKTYLGMFSILKMLLFCKEFFNVQYNIKEWAYDGQCCKTKIWILLRLRNTQKKVESFLYQKLLKPSKQPWKTLQQTLQNKKNVHIHQCYIWSSQGCGAGSLFIFSPKSGSAFNMRIRFLEEKLKSNNRKNAKKLIIL